MLTFKAEAGKTRTEKFKGKDYLVLPAVALVEGVIQGLTSPGPEFVAAEEMSKTVMGWNGRPVVVDHPQKKGKAVTANSPDVLEKSQVGFLFNTKMDGKKLTTEAWIDLEGAAELEGVVAETVTALVDGKKIAELSTGFYAAETKQDGEYEGKEYEGVLSDIVPDHLALLSKGKVGACSVKDGCGVPRTNEQGPCECEKCASARIAENDEKVLEKPTKVAILSAFAAKVGEFLGLRENGKLNDNDRRRALQAALGKKKIYGYVMLVYDDRFVYETYEGCYQRGYAIADGGAITLNDDIIEVRLESSPVPLVVNREKDKQMSKAEKVAELIANSDGSYIDEDKVELEALEETAIDGMIALAKKQKARKAAAAPPKAAAKPKAKATLRKGRANAEEVEGDEPEITGEEPEEEVEEQTPEQLAAAYLESLPEAIRETMEDALHAQADQRANLIENIKKHKANQFSEDELKAFSLATLKKLGGLAKVADFSGRGGARSMNTNSSGGLVAAPEVFPAKKQA